MRSHQRTHFSPTAHEIRRCKLGRLAATSVEDVFTHFEARGAHPPKVSPNMHIDAN